VFEKDEKEMEYQNGGVKLVCCYAHEDENLLDELKGHLSTLQRRALIDMWHDREINAGALWDQEIKNALNEAQIILLLISSDFINSDYCYGTEMQHALERHKRREARVIPVILRHVSGWEKIPLGDIQLGQIQALPKDAKPVISWINRDEAWAGVVSRIEKTVNELLRESSIIQIAPTQREEMHLGIQSSALPIGTILNGNLEVVQVLANNSTETIYYVEQLVADPHTLTYPCIVKELQISFPMTEEERKLGIEQCKNVISISRALRHRYIATFHDTFQERGNYYFVMCHFFGHTLQGGLKKLKGPISEFNVLKVIKWGMQICEALTYIHGHNPPIILPSLKPNGIMITSDDDAELIVSPEYLGPLPLIGQYLRAQNPSKLVRADIRSDIYSLGAVMYHLLTSYELDPIETPSVGGMLAKNPHLHTVRVDGRLSCPIEQVILRAIQQEPTNRFQSAEAMHDALEQCLSREVTGLIPEEG